MVKWLLMVVLSALAIYFITTHYTMLGYKTFVVRSGSMEPFIMTGDVIVVKHAGQYHFNDVITFVNSFDQIVTHRIIAIDGSTFQTKGDANHSVDGDIIKKEKIIGKVVAHVSKLGYYVAFIKTKLGLVFLFMVPILIFIMDELVKIKHEEKVG